VKNSVFFSKACDVIGGFVLKSNVSFGGKHLAVAGRFDGAVVLLLFCWRCSFNSRSKASNCPRKLKFGEIADLRFLVYS